MSESPGAGAGRPGRLRVEHLAQAVGIDTPVPRLSWRLPDGARRQLGYRITADTGWDTGRVDSDDSVLVPYAGPSLRSRDRLCWRVKAWTDAGETDWSAPCALELGLLSADDWSARWIEPTEPEPGPPGQRAAMLLRRAFALNGPVGRARAYVTAHGIYELFVNGRRVGDAELTPGYTAYASRLQVQTHDITAQLQPGVNVIGAIVSDGWFRGQVGLIRAHDQWGSTLGLLAQLEIECADGTTERVVTDEHWRSRRSHLHQADLIAGQSADLRVLTDDWCAAGGHDAGWDPVSVSDGGYANLVASPAPPVRAVQELEPVAVWPVDGGQVFDLGQNINGWVRVRRLGPAGAELVLTHGEALDARRDVTTAHLDVSVPFLPGPLPAGQVDRVVSAGRPGESYEPRHTTHGFRYVRVTGQRDDLTLGDLSGIVVHTDLERTGWFRCSEERVNRLHEAAAWSFRDNACDVPTDCPTRERAAWTGDWQIFAPTAAFLYDVAGFSVKWLRDLTAEQWSSGLVANLAPSPPAESQDGGMMAGFNGSAGWGDAAVIVPWEMYRAYGDRRLLAQQWPTMVAWMGFVERSAAEGRHPERAARHPQARPHERYLWDTGFHWGEWLVPGDDLKGPEEFEAWRRADKSDTATAYFVHSARLMSAIATVLDRGADAERYWELSDHAADAWRTEFLSPDGILSPDTQANHVRALAFELVPAEARPAVAARLVELIAAAGGHLQTGFLSTPYLLAVLADTGHLDVAYELLLCDTMPSWLYMIDRGATTVWERWNGIDEHGTPFESLNHYSKGAVVSFLHRYVAGIELLDGGPGYRHFRVAPRPGGGLTAARAAHESPYGRIEAAWSADGDRLALAVTVPPGSTAEIVLPDGPRGTVAAGRHTFTGAYDARTVAGAGGRRR